MRDLKPKKYLGQHFLKDSNISRKISSSLISKSSQTIIEIGPGMGILTQHLISKKTQTYFVELDKDSISYLNKIFPKIKKSIIHSDFLKIDLTKFNSPIGLIGNFPYNISTQIVFKAIENREFVPEFSGMFQKEVAKRIAEKEGSKVYGIMSVLTQAFYDVEYLFTVPPTVFNPPPKVDSGVIRLIRKENYTLPVDEKLFFRVVKTSFNQRRKMLRSSLKSFNLSDSLKEDPIFTMRPEQLSVQKFIELTQKIAQDNI